MDFMTAATVGNLPHYENQRMQNAQMIQQREAQKAQVQRMKEIGYALANWGDYSPQGLQAFAQKYQVGIDEIPKIAEAVKAFHTQWEKGTRMGPDGSKIDIQFDPNNPSNQRDISQTSGPATQITSGPPVDGSPTSFLVNTQTGNQVGRGWVSGDNAPNSPTAALTRLYKDDPDKLLELFNAMYQKDGMKLEVGKDGGLLFAKGPGAERMEWTKQNQTKVQEKAFNSAEQLKRIEGIATSFRPEFLQLPSKLGAEWTSLKEKLNMGEISEGDQKFLEDYSIFKQDALENINLYIKEITGAQMSEREADRIRKAMPDPGDGILGGDSPSEFKSKTINTYKKLKAAYARYNYYLNQGVPASEIPEMIKAGKVMSLDALENMMEQRAKELKTENPGATMEQIAKMVAKEFGL